MKGQLRLGMMAAAILVWIGGSLSGIAGSQQGSRDLDEYLSHLPKGLTLKEPSPRKYDFVCDYFVLDVTGKLINKQRVSGQYTRALPGGRARWNDVRIADAKGFNDAFPPGSPQTYMEGFSYSTIDREATVATGFFAGFPPAEMKTRNLVWDMLMFEQFAWDDFDKLVLNQPHQFQNDQEVNLAGAGTFKNHNIELTWTGISKYNGVTCALIRYEGFFNPLAVSVPGYDGRGRSHYWGEIWVSLQTKQIEYGTLNEDVLIEGTVAGQPAKMINNVFRKGYLKKQPG